jgi:hypothetical protein
VQETENQDGRPKLEKRELKLDGRPHLEKRKRKVGNFYLVKSSTWRKHYRYKMADQPRESNPDARRQALPGADTTDTRWRASPGEDKTDTRWRASPGEDAVARLCLEVEDAAHRAVVLAHGLV